jgi:alcohol dehydrogenase class IV
MAPDSPEDAAVWASPSVRAVARERWPGRMVSSLEEVGPGCRTLVVAGGGAMMDEAKYFRARQRPALRLVLAPSVWGSGAERSPVVVLHREGGKQIEMSAAFLPDEVVYWPPMLRSVTPERARHACGDVWAHALEAFLSPLACEALQSRLAALIQELLRLPPGVDERWFGASARACELQARASVGLTHGIAHVLEPRLRMEDPDSDWGHARLCSIFLLPVMELNRQSSAVWVERSRSHAIDTAAVDGVLRELAEPESFRRLLPLLKDNWMRILRDPCTRTNGALVRPQHLAFFEAWARP